MVVATIPVGKGPKGVAGGITIDCVSLAAVIQCGNKVRPRDAVMVKRLTKHGNSFALVIDRGVLDILDIDAETPLSVTTDGKCLIVSPIRDARRQKRFRAALEEGNRKYGRMLKRLAD